MTDNERKSEMLDNTTEIAEGDLEQAAGGLLATRFACPSCGRMDVAAGDFVDKDGKHYNRKCRKCGTLFNTH